METSKVEEQEHEEDAEDDHEHEEAEDDEHEDSMEHEHQDAEEDEHHEDEDEDEDDHGLDLPARPSAQYAFRPFEPSGGGLLLVLILLGFTIAIMARRYFAPRREQPARLEADGAYKD
jgi:hypothetical protein